MAEKDGGYRPWWMESRERIASAFPLLQSLASVKGLSGDQPLPPWTEADIRQFAQEDPEHGPQVLAARRVAQIASAGGVAGGLASAGYCFRHSKSPAGSLLVLTIGTLASWTVTEEVASLALGMYKFSPVDANLKFLQWWRAKQE